jgi:hypothetical protein
MDLVDWESKDMNLESTQHHRSLHSEKAVHLILV